MPKEKDVYHKHAEKYDQLIQREDFQQNILSTIQAITPLENNMVLDIGAGTGRLTRILAPYVKTIAALDLSMAMIKEAKNVLQHSGAENWCLAVGDNARLPVKDGFADLVVSGWSFCYLAVWSGDQWRARLQAGLDGIQRVLRKGGTMVILETMGTGFEPVDNPDITGSYDRLELSLPIPYYVRYATVRTLVLSQGVRLVLVGENALMDWRSRNQHWRSYCGCREFPME